MWHEQQAFYEALAPQPLTSRARDFRGERVGDVWPYEYLGTVQIGEATARYGVWRCRCICGATVVLYTGLFRPTASCGCRAISGVRHDFGGLRLGNVQVIAGGQSDNLRIRCDQGHRAYVTRRQFMKWRRLHAEGARTKFCVRCRLREKRTPETTVRAG